MPRLLGDTWLHGLFHGGGRPGSVCLERESRVLSKKLRHAHHFSSQIERTSSKCSSVDSGDKASSLYSEAIVSRGKDCGEERLAL